MYTISKQFHFSASHQLFGLHPAHPCSNLHGHNYIVIVELQSEDLDSVGFVLDYRALEPIKKYFDEKVDHKHLNEVFEFNPTAENMANHFYNICLVMLVDEMQISPLKAMKILKSVSVKETEKTIARYEP